MNNSVGERIKSIRMENKITQKKLAKVTGISSSSIAKYETGERKPKKETIGKLADGLSVSINKLMLGQEDITPDIETGNHIIDFDKYKIEDFYRLKRMLNDRGFNLTIYDEGFCIGVNLKKHDGELIFSTPFEEFLPYCNEMIINIDKFIRFNIDDMIKNFTSSNK
jgi:transcriptional regulator with XRE-family HTH domain